MLNFCGIVVAILKMATGRNFSMSGINSRHHYLPTYKILMISDNVEFLPPIFYAMFWQPFWKWQTSQKFGKSRIAPLMVTYHYVKFYVSIIIHLEVININVQNFNFPIGFYSNPHPLWTPQDMTLTPFTTKLKNLGPTRNCPVVPEICCGQVHDPGKKENNNNKKRCLGDLISANQRLLWHLATMLDNRS
jgi:hypothetical protein